MTLSASVLNSEAHSFRILGSQNLPCFFLTFPYPEPRPEKNVIFIGCNFESRASQVGLHKQNKDTAPEKRGDVSLLLSWVTVKKLECVEFITYEVVARSVASRPKKNAPLAVDLYVAICSMSIKKV